MKYQGWLLEQYDQIACHTVRPNDERFCNGVRRMFGTNAHEARQLTSSTALSRRQRRPLRAQLFTSHHTTPPTVASRQLSHQPAPRPNQYPKPHRRKGPTCQNRIRLHPPLHARATQNPRQRRRPLPTPRPSGRLALCQHRTTRVQAGHVQLVVEATCGPEVLHGPRRRGQDSSGLRPLSMG